MSQGLDLLCTLLTQPGDTVLVQAPVYHLALRIFADHGLPGAGGERRTGLRVEAVAAAWRGWQPRPPTAFLYTVPTWCNPDRHQPGRGPRVALAVLAEQHELLIVEDDVYRESCGTTLLAAPAATAGPEHVIR